VKAAGFNAIDETFARLKASGEPAFIPFLTAGDPDLATTVELVRAAEEAGAHMIELGVPYSDPLADGPVIQRASARALQNRVTLQDCMDIAVKARACGVKMPFILFTYYNPALQFGLERFFAALAERDFSGVIIPDLPMEEDGEARHLAEQTGIHLIPLVAPTSADRVERIVSRARGFVYAVSSLGVTGIRTSFDASVDVFLADLKRASPVPVCIGFGISSREQAVRFTRRCDGFIVGSAIVRQVEEHLGALTSADPAVKGRGIEALRAFMAGLKP
jgi:tryptophan synthase alpha chain